MNIENKINVLEARIKELQEEVRNHKGLLKDLRQKYHHVCASYGVEVFENDY